MTGRSYYRQAGTAQEGDMEKNEKIEITPAMADAGARLLQDFFGASRSMSRSIAKEVYLAMAGLAGAVPPMASTHPSSAEVPQTNP